MNTFKPIRFRDGKLRVMQISDLQDTKNTKVDTLRFVESAIEKYKPDLIIITGDQLDVIGFWKIGDIYSNVETAINRLFSVIENSGVPYALTFGNHDCETGVSNEKQAEYYSKLNNCVCFDNLNDGRPDTATFNIPVLSGDSDEVLLNFFIMDTHTKTKGVGYEGITENQLDWARNISDKLKEDNGNAVASIVFQHIPVPELFELFEPVEKSSNEHPAFKDPDGKLYALITERLTELTAYGETPSTQLRFNNQLSFMKQYCGTFAMYFGHDHYNAFVGNIDGVDLGYCPGTGFNSYGTRKRGIRIFDYREDDVKDYETFIITYDDCCKHKETSPIMNYISSKTPPNPNVAGLFAIKCTLLVLAVTILIAALYIILGKFAATVLSVFAVFVWLTYAVISTARCNKIRTEIFKKINID